MYQQHCRNYFPISVPDVCLLFKNTHTHKDKDPVYSQASEPVQSRFRVRKPDHELDTTLSPDPPRLIKAFDQRVMKDLSTTRLSRCRMIWLLPKPLPPLPSARCLLFSVFMCVSGRAYWWNAGKGVGGAKSYDGENDWSSKYHSAFEHPGYEIKSVTERLQTSI